MSGARRLGLRAEKQPFGECLTMAAPPPPRLRRGLAVARRAKADPARVIRRAVGNRLDHEVVSGAWDESGPPPTGTPTGRFSTLRRRDAARGGREFENRSAGVPIRVRRDSPPAERRTRTPTLISARRTTDPSERGIRKARAGGAVFPASGRSAFAQRATARPRRSLAEAGAPQARRAFGALDPVTTHLPTTNFQRPTPKERLLGSW
jgi:hypothetical protein